MLNLPLYIPLLMIACSLFTGFALYKASGNNKTVLWVSGIWLLLQAVVSMTGFYYASFSLPPRFALLVAPPVIFIIALFFTRRGKSFLDNLDLKTLTGLSVVRIAVELCLLLLFLHGQVPVEMTFEGRNFDVLSGLTALLMLWLAFPKNAPPRRGLLLVWNFVCLALLFNIVGMAIAASPYFEGQFGFATVNQAVLYFPFVWLPCLIVPIVLLAHLAAIRKLLGQKKMLH